MDFERAISAFGLFVLAPATIIAIVLMHLVWG